MTPRIFVPHVFYNNSAWDGNNASANSSDDNAIAWEKFPLWRGGIGSFVNYTSFSGGINGIMVDIGPALPGTPVAADFTFKIGNDNNPSLWATAPAPSSVSIRTGAGVSGSDRVTIIWSDNAIQEEWLEVTVLPTANTGLSVQQTFYFGNAIGESGNSFSDAIVNSTDESGPHNHGSTFINPAPIEFVYDYNRDKRVDIFDENLARIKGTTSTTALQLIDLSRLASFNVTEAVNYSLVYSLNVPNQANFNSTGVPYDINDSSGVGAFTRIGYYLELDPIVGSNQWVWVSMPAFSTNVAKIGVPIISSGAFYQQLVTNMNVHSSVAGITNGNGISSGNMEFWWGDYSKTNAAGVPGASNTTFDWGDSSSITNPAGAGSMQVHNYTVGQTLFAFNNWGGSPTPIDLGIGNYSGGNPDWSLAANAAQYVYKVLQVYVLIDSNGNGLPDGWELNYFGNLSQTANGDYDNDGLTNLQEFLNGTNPSSSDLSISIGEPKSNSNLP